MRIPKPCLSVCLSICPYPEKRNHHSFVNISPTLVIDTSMERSSRVLQHGNPKIWFFFQRSSKFKFWLVTKSWNHLSSVNISLTIVIDTSMERSSWVLQHGNIKIWLKKKSKLNFDLYFVWLLFFLSSKLNFDLYFELCQRDEIIQVGFNKHLYMTTSGMHRRPFEGRHLVVYLSFNIFIIS